MVAGEAAGHIEHACGVFAGAAIHRSQHDARLEDVAAKVLAAIGNEVVAVAQKACAAIKLGVPGDAADGGLSTFPDGGTVLERPAPPKFESCCRAGQSRAAASIRRR